LTRVPLFTDFNICVYIYCIITEEEEIKGIKIPRTQGIKVPLFVDDLVIVANSEDAVQISIHKLETVTLKYDLTKFCLQLASN
jgi:hypothetical protein